MSAQALEEVRRLGVEVVGVLPVPLAALAVARRAVLAEQPPALGLRAVQALLLGLLAEDVAEGIGRRVRARAPATGEPETERDQGKDRELHERPPGFAAVRLMRYAVRASASSGVRP